MVILVIRLMISYQSVRIDYVILPSFNCMEFLHMSYQFTSLDKEWWRSVLAPRPVGSPVMIWEQFTEVFLERFMLYSLWDSRQDEFDRSQQGSMSVSNYDAKFHAWSRYALSSIPIKFEKIWHFAKDSVYSGGYNFVGPRVWRITIVWLSILDIIDRVAGRDSVSMDNLVDPYHEIESFRGRAIRAKLFMQLSLNLTVLIGRGLLRHAVIAILLQPSMVVFQDNHLRGERLGPAIVVIRLGIWVNIFHIVHLLSRLQGLN